MKCSRGFIKLFCLAKNYFLNSCQNDFLIQALQETDIIKQDEIHCTGKSCTVVQSTFLGILLFSCLFGVYVHAFMCLFACRGGAVCVCMWRLEVSTSCPPYLSSVFEDKDSHWATQFHRISALPSLALHLHAAGCGFVHVSCRLELGFCSLLCPLNIRLALEGIIIIDHNLQRQPTTVTCTTHEA